MVAVIDDTLSATAGRLADRPGWRRVVEMIEADEADLIVAWHLDRVTRSLKDLEFLIDLALERNIGLATATGDIDLTTDVGRMVARILAAVASAETERKAERQILANDARVAAGRLSGSGGRSATRWTAHSAKRRLRPSCGPTTTSWRVRR